MVLDSVTVEPKELIILNKRLLEIDAGIIKTSKRI